MRRGEKVCPAGLVDVGYRQLREISGLPIFFDRLSLALLCFFGVFFSPGYFELPIRKTEEEAGRR